MEQAAWGGSEFPISEHIGADTNLPLPANSDSNIDYGPGLAKLKSTL